MSKDKKVDYFARTKSLIKTYTKVFVVTCDNVGSLQMQQIRLALRPLNTVLLMGKNTMMRKIIGDLLEEEPDHPFGKMLDLVKGNVGFVFTNGELADIKKVLVSNIVPAPAKVGGVAPIDVVVEAQVTDCDPGQTAFFQALGIATKIVKGRIEITSPVDLLKKGDKVGTSEAMLLQKLDIKPFTYGLVITHVYDNGSIFDPSVLDITADDLMFGFQQALGSVAGLSLAAGFPTMASIPNSMISAFKTLVSIAVECDDYSFAKADAYKKIVGKAPKKKTETPAAAEGGEAAEAPAAEAEAPAKKGGDY
jgi:large subunit ribosomal protein LP0